jgi:cytochrome c oxidase cbb3-type subunit II
VCDPVFTADVARGWGRPSVPEDYLYDTPHLLGTMRTGPDLLNVGVRLPDRQWHLLHLYDPRLVVDWSIMPSFAFLFTWKERPGQRDEVVNLPPGAPRQGGVLVARREARTLVDYLLSLDRSYPLDEDNLEAGR